MSATAIREAKARIQHLNHITAYEDPAVVRCQKAANKARAAFDVALMKARAKLRPQIAEAEAQLAAAREELRDKRALPPAVAELCARLSRGVNWGPGWRCNAFNPRNGRAILSQPSHSAWAAIGMRETAPSTWWVVQITSACVRETGMELMKQVQVR